MLAEVIRPQEHLSAVIDDGSLQEALSTAAVIIRLLNDIGQPLTLSEVERGVWIGQMDRHYHNVMGGDGSMAELIVSAASEIDSLTRLHKDTRHGEFNICLHNLAFVESVDEGLALLDSNLAYYSALYHEAQGHLRQVLGHIEARMRSPLVSDLIGRFVRFHEKIYANPYNSPAGEYVA